MTIRLNHWKLLAALSVAAFACSVRTDAQEVYFNDFDGNELFSPGVSGGLSGVTTTESVQGFTGIGDVGNQFSGSFLRNISAGNPATATTLSLNNLPTHSTVDLNFLLAIIDSWDGSSLPPNPTAAPDFFNVRVDGNLHFSETFTNVSPLGATQTYSPPALVSETHLGFTSGTNREDSAYDLGADLTFDDIPHSAGSITIEFFASGAGWQSSGLFAADETWAIENLSVLIPEPSVMASMTAFLVVLFLLSRRL